MKTKCTQITIVRTNNYGTIIESDTSPSGGVYSTSDKNEMKNIWPVRDAALFPFLSDVIINVGYFFYTLTEVFANDTT